jgi:hypothetical protein
MVRETWGPGYILILNTVNNIGPLYRSQGKMNEAEKTYSRAPEWYEMVLGLENITTFVPAINNNWVLRPSSKQKVIHEG